MSANPRPLSSNFSEAIETLKAFNAITEGQGTLTPAELRLALILVRRGAHRESVNVSARNWEDWTWLNSKSRELAIRGLQRKGFHVEGRGDRAKFRFDTSEWRTYCRQADRTAKPHVDQKRAPAKPGQMIHPECRERGCFMARQAEESNLISIDAATPNRKQVSDFALDSLDQTIPHNQANGVGSSSGSVRTDSLSEQTEGRQALRNDREISPDSTHGLDPTATSAAEGPCDNKAEVSCPTNKTNSNQTTNSPTMTTTSRKTNQTTTSATTAEPISRKATNTTSNVNSTAKNSTATTKTTNPKSAFIATPNRKQVSNSAICSRAENSTKGGQELKTIGQESKRAGAEVRVQSQSSAPVCPDRSENGYSAFVGLFLAAGKPINERDLELTRARWFEFSFDDQIRAYRAAREQLLRTLEPRFIPLPANFLRAKSWTRSAPKRTLPHLDPKTEREIERSNQVMSILEEWDKAGRP